MSFDFKGLMPKEYTTQQSRAKALSNKWQRTGLLEGLEGQHKGNVATLLENQARQLVVEANRTGTTAGSEEWSGIALPLVRRVFSQIVAKEFVSVQPMNMPSGLVFYLDFKYATAQPGFTTSAGKGSQRDSLFGVTDANRGTALDGGLYGAGRFGYTINDYTSSALQAIAAASLTVNRFATGSVTWTSDLNYNSAFSASAAAAGSRLIKVTVSASSAPNLDTNGARAFVLQNSTGDFLNTTYQEFTSYNATTKVLTFIVSGSTLVGTDRIKLYYHKQPTDVTRGDFEEGKTQAGAGTQALDIPSIDIDLRQEEIIAKTRKLKASWTPEFAQDLARYQNIDAEAELTAMLSEYISQEIDFEILDMLIRNAQTTDYWSTRIGYEYSSGPGTFSAIAANLTAYTQFSWFQTLGTKIQKVSNKIHQLTLRGGANFLVTSPTVATVLESIPGYSADTDGRQSQFAMGVQKIGTFSNQFTVYKNPYMTENIILMGYRGTQFLECGAVYAPYIPLLMTPLIYDPDNFTPRKGVMTRYAKKMVRPEFYAKIYVEGLNTL